MWGLGSGEGVQIGKAGSWLRLLEAFLCGSPARTVNERGNCRYGISITGLEGDLLLYS